MKEFLKHPIFKIVSNIISKENQQAYVIGGFVRDLLLERPSKDIDIVTVGSGIELAKKVAKSVGKHCKVNVFKNFGTAMLRYKDLEVEFVGARKESYQRDSRKPIVENGTLEDDQKRRDFTINALALSLHKDTYGEMLDPFDGVADLKKKIIRTPLEPETTFSDDPLRMMRAIRFATQLNFRIEPVIFEAIKTTAHRIEIISKERVVDELNKILKTEKPSIGLRLLNDSGLLPYIMPEIENLKGVESKNGLKHKDNFWHTLQVVDNVAKCSDKIWLRWAALLHDIGKPPTKRFAKNGWTFHGHEVVGAKMVNSFFKKMHMPLNDSLKYVKKLVFLHLRPIVLSQDVVSDSAVRRLLFDAGDDVEDLMLLAEADVTSKNDTKLRLFLNNFKIVRQKLKEIEEKDAVRNFQPPISGDDVMKIFQIAPSKIVGDIKNAIKEAILDGIIRNSRKEAYFFMLEEAKKSELSPVSPLSEDDLKEENRTEV